MLVIYLTDASGSPKHSDLECVRLGCQKKKANQLCSPQRKYFPAIARHQNYR